MRRVKINLRLLYHIIAIVRDFVDSEYRRPASRLREAEADEYHLPIIRR
ncbi:hypothetical protein KCP75_10010 [Salmonella enterica subsp. enterica]|nr:hypothetical protein KCP75_10010 [Salmonella enterica subsp. enterica]